jgi:hypothetical protein
LIELSAFGWRLLEEKLLRWKEVSGFGFQEKGEVKNLFHCVLKLFSFLTTEG